MARQKSAGGAILSLGFIAVLSACTANVQPAVTQFGTAVTTAQSAESGYFAALNQKMADAATIRMLGSRYVVPKTDGSVWVKGDSHAPTTTIVPSNVIDAINGLLKPIQAYGQAMTALSGDTAATTLNTNVDNLAKQAAAFDTSVLAPLGATGLPNATQLSAVGKAVEDLGDAVIAAMIAKDVKAAANNAQKPLSDIVSGLKTINGYWATQLPQDLQFRTTAAAAAVWNDPTRSPSWSERVALKAVFDAAATPMTPDAANKALDALVTANTAIANAGPVAAKTEIQNLAQLANDAAAAYSSFQKK